MGIFSSSYRTFVGAVCTPLFEEVDKRNWKLDAVLFAVLNDQDITEAVLDAVLRKKQSYQMDKYYAKGKAGGLQPSVTYTNYNAYNIDMPEWANPNHNTVLLTPGTAEYDAYVEDAMAANGNGLEEDDWFPPEDILGDPIAFTAIILTPEINKSLTSEFDPFPIVELRKDKRMVDVSKKTKDGKLRRKLFNYCGLDAEGMQRAVSENPDVDKLDDVALLTRISLSTTNPLGLRALWAYFNRIGGTLGWDSSDGARMIRYATGEYNTTTVINNISKKTVEGVIGELYEVTRTADIRDFEYTVVHNTHGTQGEGEMTSYHTVANPAFTFRKQVTDTTYEEIYIDGIDFVTTVEGLTASYEWEEWKEGAEDSPFYIQLDTNLLWGDELNGEPMFSELEQSDLVNLSLALGINTLVRQEIKWYQSGFFKFVMIVVGAVLAFWTGGASAVIVFALLTIVSLAFGEKIGLIGAVLMAIVTLGATIGNVITQVVTLTATQVMSATMSIVSQVITLVGKGYEYYLTGEMDDLTQEAADWDKARTDAQKTIDEALDLLGPPRVPFNTIGSPYFDPDETPETFVYRTLDMDVIDTLYAIYDKFVDSSLELPTITQTMKYT